MQKTVKCKSYMGHCGGGAVRTATSTGRLRQLGTKRVRVVATQRVSKNPEKILNTRMKKKRGTENRKEKQKKKQKKRKKNTDASSIWIPNLSMPIWIQIARWNAAQLQKNTKTNHVEMLDNEWILLLSSTTWRYLIIHQLGHGQNHYKKSRCNLRS